MKSLKIIPFYADGKKNYQKTLKKELKRIKGSLHQFKIKKLRKNLKDSEYCNF